MEGGAGWEGDVKEVSEGGGNGRKGTKMLVMSGVGALETMAAMRAQVLHSAMLAMM